MKRTILALCLALVSGPSVWAQGGGAMLGGPVEVVQFTPEPVPLRGWASADYLHWWVRSQPAPGPLVSTGNPASQNAGLVTDPSTTVLFGDNKIEYGAFSGGRITVGTWIDSESITGIELSAFYLNPRTTSFQAESDATGVPILAMPFETITGGPGAYYAASNGNQPVAATKGSIGVTTSSRFLGAELNGVFNAWRLPGDNLELVLGLRYLDLQENLETNFVSTALRFDAALAGNDRFTTRNHFLGAQVGARWTGGVGRWTTSFAGLIGVGGTNRITSIDGSTTITGTAVPNSTVPGLLYTEPTNIGRYQQTVFSAVPQFQAKVGYDILRSLRITFGYDFICWTNVVRPSEQIDNVVNTTQQSPVVSPDGALKLTGEARPSPRLNGSSFWAQGIICGMELRW